MTILVNECTANCFLHMYPVPDWLCLGNSAHHVHTCAHDAIVSEGKTNRARVAQGFSADIIARGCDSNGVIAVAQPPHTTRVTV
jgi:hypothetical protein